MLTRKARISTEAASQMLIRWRLDTLKSRVLEYDLTVSVTLVASYYNLANQLTRVPYRWYIKVKMVAEPSGQTCPATVSMINQQQIKDIHVQSRHLGIKRTLHFVRRVDPAAAKTEIKQVIKNCEMFQSVDWPSTNTMPKRMTRSKWCMAKGWNGYHLLWWQPLSHPHWLWTHP